MNLDINFPTTPGFKEGDVVYLTGEHWPWKYRGTEQVVAEGGCVRLTEAGTYNNTITSFYEIKKDEHSDYSAWLVKTAEMVKLERIEKMLELLGTNICGEFFTETMEKFDKSREQD